MSENETMNDGAMDWGVLGEVRWRELQEATGASDLQLKFAVYRFGGATAAKAAKLAGYSDDGPKGATRRAGYTALRSTAVQNLLELASINAPGDAKISKREVVAKISKLCRSSDPLVSLKAIEALAKYETAEKASGETPDDDGLDGWRIERDYLLLPNGAVAYLLMHLDRPILAKGQKGSGGLQGNVANLCLLHDTYALLHQQRFGPELWQLCVDRLSEAAKADLDRKLADRGYQLEVRKKVWAEVGVQLDDRGQFTWEAAYVA
jgi:hypothetical protein